MENKNAIILSVGGSPEPLIFCLKNYDYDFVYFLHSKDSKKDAFTVIDELDISEDKYSLKQVDDHQSLEDAFAKSREIIKELQKNSYDIHVDFTGGTKTMVSGLVLAAIGERCNYTYVGTEENRTKNNVGIVKSGFEKIKEQKDPYDLYAVMEFEKGMDFFNRYQFEAAKVNFEEAFLKLESEKLKKLSEIYLELVRLYDSWDKFKNDIDGKVLNNYLERIILPKLEMFDNDLNNDYPNLISQVKNNIEFLKLKIPKKKEIKPKNIPYYISDMLNNVNRRIEEGKYDDAVARLYRTIELIAQFLLVEENLINDSKMESKKKFYIDKNKVYNLDIDKIDAKEFIMELHQFKEDCKNFGIPLKKSFEVLDKLNIPIANKYLMDKEIQYNINSRNSSILAHGLNDIEKENALELYGQVFEYAREVFSDVEKYMEMAKFPKFES